MGVGDDKKEDKKIEEVAEVADKEESNNLDADELEIKRLMSKPKEELTQEEIEKLINKKDVEHVLTELGLGKDDI